MHFWSSNKVAYGKEKKRKEKKRKKKSKSKVWMLDFGMEL